MKRIIECLILVICGEAFSIGQQAISTAGGDATGAGGSVSYTIGQTDYLSLTGSSGSALQGVQQPYEILVVTAIEPDKGITLECAAYPNPAKDFLVLKIIRDRLEDMSYQLIDMNGKILNESNIEKSETTISLQNFVRGNYFLKVIGQTKEIKTFKITKN